MPRTIAVIENDIVTNIIIDEDAESAEAALGKKCVEYTSENPAYVGGLYTDGVFYPPALTIVRPEYPTDGAKYIWNEVDFKWDYDARQANQ